LIDFFKISKEAGSTAFMNKLLAICRSFQWTQENGAYGKIHAVIADLLCKLCERNWHIVVVRK